MRGGALLAFGVCIVLVYKDIALGRVLEGGFLVRWDGMGWERV